MRSCACAKLTDARRLIILHAWIVLLLFTSSTSGFDGSLMNSFQSLNNWKDYFDNPQGGKLGVLNAMQVRGVHAGFRIWLTASSEYWIPRGLPYRTLLV